MKARFLVLGMLHGGNLHPYEIKRRFDAAMVDCYLDVDVGTLYYAIRQLEKEGSIASVAQERVVRGGVRTIYRITPPGRIAFEEDFFRQLEEDGPVSRTLYGVVLFLHRVDCTKLIQAMRRRIARLDELIGKLQPLHQQMAASLSTGGEHLFRHIEQQRRLDRDWLAGLLADIETAQADEARISR
jgi:DNA-binding PadR family transcriptional regulator